MKAIFLVCLKIETFAQEFSCLVDTSLFSSIDFSGEAICLMSFFSDFMFMGFGILMSCIWFKIPCFALITKVKLSSMLSTVVSFSSLLLCPTDLSCKSQVLS